MIQTYFSIIEEIQILFRNYMITKKVILLALLGFSALNCADTVLKSRVEGFLARSTYQADFKALPDDQKRQLAQDLNEVYDTLEGVAVKKANLRRLCEPFLDKGGAKAQVEVSRGIKAKAYEAAAASSSSSPARVHVVPGRLSGSSGSDVPPLSDGVAVGRLSLDAPAVSPPRAPVVVPKLAADRLAFFQQQSADLERQVAAKKGKGDAARDQRLNELTAELGALRGPLDGARAALELAARAKGDAEGLRQTAIEDEMRAVDGERGASESERLAVESEGKARGIKESVEAMMAAYGLSTGEVDSLSDDPNITQRKQDLFRKYGVLESEGVVATEGKLARITPAERSVLAADMLSQSKAALEAARLARERMERARAEATVTRERAARSKADAEALLQEAIGQEAHADEILRGLADRFRLLSEEIDAMTAGK